jgi:phytoene synthase
MTPEQYCEQKAAPRGSALYYSLLFVPPEQRLALTALRALQRELRDAVEQASDPGLARTRLLWWREELSAALAGRSQHPVINAVCRVLSRWELPREQLVELLDGAQMDLDYNRYPDFATLEVYCSRMSGVVCLLSARVLGHSHPATMEFARTLGTALQLATIIRDAGADARRNRIYLPLEDLHRFDLETDDIIALREDERFERLMTFEIERAQNLFERAGALLNREDRKAQRAHLIMAALDGALLDEIARLRGHTLNQRVALTPLRKLWIAWRTWVAA